MQQSPDILLITDTVCDANGVSRFIQDIARQSSEKNQPFHCISSTKKCLKSPHENITILQPFFTLKMPFYPDLDLVFPPAVKLYRLIKNLRPKVIHISTPGMIGVVGLIIARRFKIPVAGTYHTDFPAYLYANTDKKAIFTFTAWFEKLFYKPFSLVFIRSEVYRKTVTQRLQKNNDMVHTIPAGINTKRFGESYKNTSIWEKYAIPSEAPKALYVGRMTKEKNVAFLLEIWKEVFDQTNNGWLIMVGSGSFTAKSDAYEDYNVRFLGHKEGDELSTLYASSDFFLFPSTTDTLGQVVIEALASGLPAVVSDVGGPQTLINKRNCNGYILEANNKHIWTKTIKRLIEDSRTRQALRQSALESAKCLDIQNSFTFFWQKHQQLEQHSFDHKKDHC